MTGDGNIVRSVLLVVFWGPRVFALVRAESSRRTMLGQRLRCFGAALASVSLSAAPPGQICGKSEDFTLDL